jgi:transcriptional regulator GlxA family with amidase domain
MCTRRRPCSITTKTYRRRSKTVAKSTASERQLHRLFVEYLGTPPGRFVRRLRLDTAAHLLVETAHPIATIARRCGFNSVEALRQAFVHHYGAAPTRYRETCAADDRSG